METISVAKGRGGTAWRKYHSKKKRQEQQLKLDEVRAAKAHEQVQKDAARAAKTLGLLSGGRRPNVDVSWPKLTSPNRLSEQPARTP